MKNFFLSLLKKDIPVCLLALCLCMALTVVSSAEQAPLQQKDTGQPMSQAVPMSEVRYGGKTLSEFAGLSLPSLEAYSAYCIHLESGSVMAEVHAEDPVYPASTVKLMTALVVSDQIKDLDLMVTVTQDAVRATKGSNINLKEGEQLSVHDLLCALLISGANDAALVLAEYTAGGVAPFCELMNQKAQSLGALHTVYSNPTGLHEEEMVTTAHDMAIIARAFYYNNTLAEMTNISRYDVPATNLSPARVLLNRNEFVSKARSSANYYPNALGLSSGSTPEGGMCLVTTASKGGHTYLCVVMNSAEVEGVNFAYADAKAILDFCFEHFDYKMVANSKNMVCEIPVTLASNTDHVAVFAKEDLEALLPVDLAFQTDIRLERLIYEEPIAAPITKGQKCGELVVYYKNDVILGKTDLVALNNIDRSNLLYFFNRIETFLNGRWFRVFMIAAILLFLLYLILSFSIRARRRRYDRYKKGKRRY